MQARTGPVAGKCAVFRDLITKSWPILAVCGALDVLQAVVNLMMASPSWALPLGRHAVKDMGVLALCAGACAIAAGVRNSRSKLNVLLATHGLALSAFGVIGLTPLVRGPLSFRPVALLFFIMAASIGAFALGAARRLAVDAQQARTMLRVAGAISICFAVSFVAVALGWLRVRPPLAFWTWMACYFAFCAVFFLRLAIEARGTETSPHVA